MANWYETAFQLYERARTRYIKLDQDLGEELRRLGARLKDATSPLTVRDLAHVEGVKAERDTARQERDQAEDELLRLLARNLGTPPA